jgi:hypothetical protein
VGGAPLNESATGFFLWGRSWVIEAVIVGKRSLIAASILRGVEIDRRFSIPAGRDPSCKAPFLLTFREERRH